MKTKLILSLVLLLSIFSSCDKEDDQIYRVADIDGEWSLVNVSGGENGIDKDHEEGLIRWTISDQSLIIVNNNPLDDYDSYDSGNYSISVLENEDGLYLIFGGREYGKINLSQNEMTIDQNNRTYSSFNDLYKLKFRK